MSGELSATDAGGEGGIGVSGDESSATDDGGEGGIGVSGDESSATDAGGEGGIGVSGDESSARDAGGEGGIGVSGESSATVLAATEGVVDDMAWLGVAIAVETNIAKAALMIRKVLTLKFLVFCIAIRSLDQVAEKDYPKLCRSSSTKVIICSFLLPNGYFLSSARHSVVLKRVVFAMHSLVKPLRSPELLGAGAARTKFSLIS